MQMAQLKWFEQSYFVDGCRFSPINWISVIGIMQVPIVASNRIGTETIKTEHGDSVIAFYGNSFIAGIYCHLIRSCYGIL